MFVKTIFLRLGINACMITTLIFHPLQILTNSI